MKPSEELSQTSIVRYPGGSVTWGRRQSDSALPATPLLVNSPAWRLYDTPVPPALRLKRLPGGQEFPLESP
jgi:hypothetical protein